MLRRNITAQDYVHFLTHGNRVGLHYSPFSAFSGKGSPANQRLTPEDFFKTSRIRQVGLTGVTGGWLVTGCEDQVDKESRLQEAIRLNVEVSSVDEGPVTLSEKGVFRSYAVRVTNHFDKPIYIEVIWDPKILSKYITDGNPDGYCYFIMKQTADGRWQDGSMGLQSTSTLRRALWHDQSIEFKAPVRLYERPMDNAVASVHELPVYCSAADRNGTPIEEANAQLIPALE